MGFSSLAQLPTSGHSQDYRFIVSGDMIISFYYASVV